MHVSGATSALKSLSDAKAVRRLRIGGNTFFSIQREKKKKKMHKVQKKRFTDDACKQAVLDHMKAHPRRLLLQEDVKRIIQKRLGNGESGIGTDRAIAILEGLVESGLVVSTDKTDRTRKCTYHKSFYELAAGQP